MAIKSELKLTCTRVSTKGNNVFLEKEEERKTSSVMLVKATTYFFPANDKKDVSIFVPPVRRE